MGIGAELRAWHNGRRLVFGGVGLIGAVATGSSAIYSALVLGKLADAGITFLLTTTIAGGAYRAAFRSWVEIDGAELTIVNPFSTRKLHVDPSWSFGPEGWWSRHMPPYLEKGSLQVELGPLNPVMDHFGPRSENFDEVVRRIRVSVGQSD